MCLSLFIIVTCFSSTVISFTNDNHQYGWRIIESKIGEWEVVAPPNLKIMATHSRRSLRDGSSLHGQPSPHRAPESHGGDFGGGIP
ncbi:hypothetical protein vseg_013927 [Gypsophila vaccaria]